MHGFEKLMHGFEKLMHGFDELIHGFEKPMYGFDKLMHGFDGLLHGECSKNCVKKYNLKNRIKNRLGLEALSWRTYPYINAPSAFKNY